MHKKEIMSFRSGETDEEEEVKKVSKRGKCLKKLFRLTADETGRIKGLRSAFVVILPKVVRVIGMAIPLITIIILLCLKPTPIATMMFKVHDLRGDVDCLKSTYGVSIDPNKTRIERVLSNMKRKLIKADQILKFGQSSLEYCITEDKTKLVLNRVQKLKELFKDLLKGQGNVSTPERRSLSQMFHQLLSMEEELVHFSDPKGTSTGRCRSKEEPSWTPAKDCEVQAVLMEGMTIDGIISSEDMKKANGGKNERIVCCTYPEITESSDCGEDETRGTVFSITDRRAQQLQFTNCIHPTDNYSVSNSDEANCVDVFQTSK